MEPVNATALATVTGPGSTGLTPGESLVDAAARLEADLQGQPPELMAEVLARLAEVRLRQNRLDDVARLASEAYGLDPQNRLARALLGVATARNGDPEEAVRLLVGAPDAPVYCLAQAEALDRLGEYTDAEDAARRALLHAPDDPEALCLLGEILSHQRRHSDALRVLGQAQRIAPGHPEVQRAQEDARLALMDPGVNAGEF